MNPGKPLKIAVDIGGTFTDGVVEDAETSLLLLAKTLTTPADPGEGVATVVASLIAQAAPHINWAVAEVVHGTTIITNAIIERKGANIALVLTEGTKDVLDLRRENRYDIYDLDLIFPEPLASEANRIEVCERLAPDGSVVTALSDAEVARVLDELDRLKAEAVAICFLHCYVNSEHEDRLAEAIGNAFPTLPVSRSSAVAREIREYERMSTVTANAYVQPLATSYLRELRDRLSQLGVNGPLRIMLSSGGFISSDSAADIPISVLESGPAAGVLSALNTAELAGYSQVLAFDMGGTTAKACVVVDGQPALTNIFEAGRVKRFKRGSGIPIVVPSIDLIEIGAGGGSIARITDMGLLKVGPESAGSVPGPACYDRGGTEPTVTDADLLLGYLDPDYFLGGRMALSLDAARQAISGVAEKLDMDVDDVAFGIHNLVCESMAAAARVHIAEKGFDPRQFTLVATGGAGPVHAVEVAVKLGIKTVLCSVAAGNGSCLGLLVAPARVDRSWSRVELITEIDWPYVQSVLDGLQSDAEAELAAAGADLVTIDWQLALEMRYVGQGDTITVNMPFADIEATVKSCLEKAFITTYERLYGRTVPDGTLEVVTWRLIGSGPKHFRRFNVSTDTNTGDEPLLGHRRVYLPQSRCFEEIPVYSRYRLASGISVDGPAILQEPESTIVVTRPARVDILADHTVRVEIL